MTAPHILLISLETIRRDRLRAHGCARDLAPHLNRLMRGGAYCLSAVSNSGWTLPQNATFLTGLYPLTHDLRRLREQPPLSKDFTFLAEHLKAHGYQTFAGVNNRNAYSGTPEKGFDRGFDEFIQGADYNQHMDWTEDFILSHFRDNHAKRPCFQFIHINDTHEPFDAPQPWRNMWGDSYESLYEGDITYVDHHLGRVFAGLKEMGIFDEMLIVIAGDHGTEFWEHGFIEKKLNLYNEILHVPLIIHCPARIPAATPLPGLAESVQVAPTIVDIAGLPPIPTAQGKSLLPRIQGREPGLEYVCSHTSHEHQRQGGPILFDHFAIQTETRKFIRMEIHRPLEDFPEPWRPRAKALAVRCGIDAGDLGPGAVTKEFYNLVDDPKEGKNLLIERAEHDVLAAAELESKLGEWIEVTTSSRRA